MPVCRAARAKLDVCPFIAHAQLRDRTQHDFLEFNRYTGCFLKLLLDWWHWLVSFNVNLNGISAGEMACYHFHLRKKELCLEWWTLGNQERREKEELKKFSEEWKTATQIHETYRCWFPSSKSQNEVEGAFLLDVVVRKSAAILELLPCENQTLLIGWDACNATKERRRRRKRRKLPSQNTVKHVTSEQGEERSRRLSIALSLSFSSPSCMSLTFFVLNFWLDILYGIGVLHFKGNGLTREGLYENLHDDERVR